jgi:hypothetical protein
VRNDGHGSHGGPVRNFDARQYEGSGADRNEATDPYRRRMNAQNFCGKGGIGHVPAVIIVDGGEDARASGKVGIVADLDAAPGA